MIKRVSVLVAFSLLFSIILGLTIGVFDAGDSFAYAALGEYLLHGRLLPMIPFNLDHPQTLLRRYTLCLLLHYYLCLSRGDLSLPIAQFLLLLGSATILFFIISRVFPKRWAAVGAFIFIFSHLTSFIRR